MGISVRHLHRERIDLLRADPPQFLNSRLN